MIVEFLIKQFSSKTAQIYNNNGYEKQKIFRPGR